MLNSLEYVGEKMGPKKRDVTRAHARGARVKPARSYAQLSDDELVRLAQAGHTRPFDELIRRYRDRVYRLAYRILRHEEDAADSVQDAFLSAYRGLPSFKGESAFSTWLYRIASNASLMRYRKRHGNVVSLEQSQSDDESTGPIAIADWSEQPIEEIVTAETLEIIGDGASRLPEGLRIVFRLRDIEELSNSEVAESLGISVAAVKSRLHRAHLQLRERLRRYFADQVPGRDGANGTGTRMVGAHARA